MSEIRTVLHPTDFSPSSRLAFQLAESLALKHGAKLIVLHVSQTYPGVGREVPEELLSESAREGLQAIQPRDPNLEMRRLVLSGPTAEVIIEFAQENACDLIVMGTHGRTGLAHALLGSVAEKLVREAPCPVLTVRLPPPHRSDAGAER